MCSTSDRTWYSNRWTTENVVDHFAGSHAPRSENARQCWRPITGRTGRVGRVLRDRVRTVVNLPDPRPGLLWAGTDDGLIHVTHDGGKSWKKRHAEMARVDARVDHRSVAAQSAHCVRGGQPLSARRQGLRYSGEGDEEDAYGATWTKITDGIVPTEFTLAPSAKTSLPSGHAVRGDACAECGCRTDAGAHWPESPVRNLPVLCWLTIYHCAATTTW